MDWIKPRIWRCSESSFYSDEPLDCHNIYTFEVLNKINSQGFDSIWMRGRLQDLIRSNICPELNDSRALCRIKNINTVIKRGEKYGMKLFLYFNEPLALDEKHDFWRVHPDLKGEPIYEPDLGKNVAAFCTSTPKFMDFFDESVSNLFNDMIGLGGVILITASEFQTHCWSHRALRATGDAYLERCLVPIKCPNCRKRKPENIVADLVKTWAKHSKQISPAPEVWVWNWSWSMWYDQPQEEIIRSLPHGVKVLCDFERGGIRQQEVGDIFIDEYALGYVGPSERFMGAMNAAKARNLSVTAKLQIGTSHELATVPNLPLIPNLFHKLRVIDELQLDGLMCSWNFGNSESINTAAFRQFIAYEGLRKNERQFYNLLIKEYFDIDDEFNIQLISKAWDKFCKAFNEYPFTIKMLYFGPINYAVAYPLLLKYKDISMGQSWIYHKEWGDRLEECIEPFTIDEFCKCLHLVESIWLEGLDLYESSVLDTNNKNQMKELNCVKMIALHLSATKNIFEFHRWRTEKMIVNNLKGPCTLDADDKAINIILSQIKIQNKALELVKKDSRFGYHQEPNKYFYDAKKIEESLHQMNDALTKAVKGK